MIPTTQPDGTLETRGGRHVIRFERRLSHPVEEVWSALTEPDELIGWLAQAKLDLVEGGDVELRWQNTNNEGEQTVLHGTITELDPPHVIEYETDLHGVLRWELREAGDGSVLRFSSSLPAPNDEVASFLAGWHIHLDHLEDALAGGAVDWPRWGEEHRPSWAAHHERYLAARD
jgi:uncharacterized protein YndB with AHSA1/START domain